MWEFIKSLFKRHRARSQAPFMQFELYEGEGERNMSDPRKLWYWRLRARNGKIVADGAQGYTSKDDAKYGIVLVQETSADTPVKEL